MSVFAFCACDSSSNGYDSTDRFGCTNDDQCLTGRCLSSGECAKLMRIGELCDSWSAVCMEGLKCESEKCVWEDGAVDRCMTDRDCSRKQVCHEAGCIYTDGTCRHDSDCVLRNSDSICMPNGKCGHYLEVGEVCGEGRYCKASHACREVCVALLEEGYTCSENDPLHVCNSDLGLACLDGICHKYEGGLGRGEACNDSYLICDAALVCQDGRCIEVIPEGEACDESEARICDEGMACIGGQCRIRGKECAETGVCDEGDSFCCMDETCGAVGYCLHFGSSEHRDSCRFEPHLGRANVQCRWHAETGGSSVEMPPLIGHFGNDEGLERVIAVYSYPSGQENTGGTTIYFVDPDQCKTLHKLSVPVLDRWYHYPAAADLDGDGILELVAIGSGQDSHPLTLYRWDSETKQYVEWMQSSLDFRAAPMIFDIDGDGNPEIIGPFGQVVSIVKDEESGEIKELIERYGSALYEDTNDGAQGYSYHAGSTAAVGFLLKEDYPEAAQLVTGEGLYTWQLENGWKKLAAFENLHEGQPAWARQFPAYADFGTPGESPESFDFASYDGKPEIVISGKNHLRIYSIETTGSDEDGKPMYTAREVMHVEGMTAGGPVSIADFDGDGFPEIAMASQGRVGVYDPGCTEYTEGECADTHVRWERMSEGGASAGAVSFDLDADGRVELVYADDCTTRIYDGRNGKVLSSIRRTSLTSIDMPTVADADGDGTAEILVGSSENAACYGSDLPDSGADPIDEGIACLEDADCPTGTKCHAGMMLCTCESDDACNAWGDKGMYRCVDPIHPDTGKYIHGEAGRVIQYPVGTRPESYDVKVCRAVQKPGMSEAASDESSKNFTIIQARDGGWASARGIWNQHAYHSIHIQDDGRVTTRESWMQCSEETAQISLPGGGSLAVPVYNHYRMNPFLADETGLLPDMTTALDPEDLCRNERENQSTLRGKVCNRGTRAAQRMIPVSFYIADKPETPEVPPADPEFKSVCSTNTVATIPVGECVIVECSFDRAQEESLNGKLVRMTANVSEDGLSLRNECDSRNNAAMAEIGECQMITDN